LMPEHCLPRQEKSPKKGRAWKRGRRSDPSVNDP
jgi:hypothetical protein